MLSRDLRLLSVTISPILRRGIRIHTDSLDFLYQKHQTEKRFACVVSAKVDKLAVGRNRIKRLVHGAIQSIIPRMTTGIHGVFVVRKKIVLSQKDAIALIQSILESAGVIA